MGCLFVILAAFSPRLALAFIWIFTTLVDRAFDGFLLPLLGLILLPWTTIFYVFAYNPIGGVTGIGWVFVALGFLFDLGAYGAGARERARR